MTELEQVAANKSFGGWHKRYRHRSGVLGCDMVVAAGNEGPNLGTVGSPAGGPWVIAAAASSRRSSSPGSATASG